MREKYEDQNVYITDYSLQITDYHKSDKVKGDRVMSSRSQITDCGSRITDNRLRITDYPGVAIIILNWNGWEDTIECLESLYRITYSNGSKYAKLFKFCISEIRCGDKEMRILITGGAGFIGCNFMRYMLNKYPDDEIVVLGSFRSKGR